jgi:hypothetical protein
MEKDPIRTVASNVDYGSPSERLKLQDRKSQELLAESATP